MRIHHQDLIDKLKELDPSFSLHIAYLNKWGRAGLYHRGKLISNVDAGMVPEFDTHDKPSKEFITVSPGYALSHPDICITQHILIEPDNLPMLQELNKKLGLKMKDEVEFGTYRVIATREKVQMGDGSIDDAILVRRYIKKITMPSHIEKIGWRRIFSSVVKAKIEGVTRETIGKKFDVVLKKKFIEVKSFQDYMVETA